MPADRKLCADPPLGSLAQPAGRKHTNGQLIAHNRMNLLFPQNLDKLMPADRTHTNAS